MRAQVSVSPATTSRINTECSSDTLQSAKLAVNIFLEQQCVSLGTQQEHEPAGTTSKIEHIPTFLNLMERTPVQEDALLVSDWRR